MFTALQVCPLNACVVLYYLDGDTMVLLLYACSDCGAFEHGSFSLFQGSMVR